MHSTTAPSRWRRPTWPAPLRSRVPDMLGGEVEPIVKHWGPPPMCLYFRPPKRLAPAGLPLSMAEQCPRNRTIKFRNAPQLLLCWAARVATQLAPGAARIVAALDRAQSPSLPSLAS